MKEDISVPSIHLLLERLSSSDEGKPHNLVTFLPENRVVVSWTHRILSRDHGTLHLLWFSFLNQQVRDNSRLRRFHFKTWRKEEKELKRYCAFLFFLFFCLLFLFLLLLLFFQTYFYEGVSAKITLEEKKRCSPSGSDHVFSRFSRFAQTF